MSTRFWYILVASVCILYGCDATPLTRHYEEVFMEADRSPPPHAMPAGQRSMPQDAVHAGLDPNQMPQDAIHSGLLNNGNMPDDAIHAGLTNRTMPDDDIHAGFKSQTAPPLADGMSMSNMPVTPELERSVDRSPLTWQTPSGWAETKGSGMRLATFTTTGGSGPTETSIISLGGQAGGLEANVGRWMRQVNISVGQAELQRFLAQQPQLTTASGLSFTLIDLTGLQTAAPADAPSMIAAIIDRGRSQIFVKMTGSKAAVSAQMSNLKNLVESIAEK